MHQDDDSINAPSVDSFNDSPPVELASRGEILTPKVLYGSAPGANSFRENPDILAKATLVSGVDEIHKMNHPHAYCYHDVYTRPKTEHLRVRYMIAVCSAAMFGVIIAVIVVLSIQTSTRQDVDDFSSGYSPTFSPSTSAEAIFLQEIAAIVGDGVLEENSALERAAKWMMHLDPMGIGPFDPHFIQRYLLVAFYFSTTNNMGHRWKSCSASDNDESAVCSFGLLYRQEDDTLGYEFQPGIRWLSAESECTWAGVTCIDGHVSAIELAGQNLTGPLPAEISFLPFLQSLSLHYNEFTGVIPIEFSRMRYLVNLDLHGNELSRSIPNELYSLETLEQLNLGENELTGTISTLLGQLTGLKGLYLHDNYFEGSIPSEIGNLRFLMYTRWSYNRFVGSIPTSIGRVTALFELWLQGNALTGFLPTQLSALKALEDLQLFENRLSGSIPEEIYDMVSLERLELSSNDFSGTISTRIGDLVRLTDLRLAKNAMIGAIPSNLSNLKKLRIMWLHMNQFEGEVPVEICDNVGVGFLEFLNADCGPANSPTNPCDCCTGCCDRSTEICLKTSNSFSN